MFAINIYLSHLAEYKDEDIIRHMICAIIITGSHICLCECLHSQEELKQKCIQYSVHTVLIPYLIYIALSILYMRWLENKSDSSRQNMLWGTQTKFNKELHIKRRFYRYTKNTITAPVSIMQPQIFMFPVMWEQ